MSGQRLGHANYGMPQLLWRSDMAATTPQIVETQSRNSLPLPPSQTKRRLPGPAPHILLCVGNRPEAADTLAHVARLVAENEARWTALYVEAAFSLKTGLKSASASETLRRADALGAQVVVVRGWSVARTIAKFIVENRVTHFVIGKGARRTSSSWVRSLTSRVVDRLSATSVDITIVDGAERSELTSGRALRDVEMSPFPWPYLYGVGMLGIASAVSISLSSLLPAESFGLVYLMPVLFTALFFGYMPSIVISVLSVLAFDFFIIPPVYSLAIGSTEDVLALSSFIAVAAIVSSLTSESRRQRVRLIERMHTTEDLLLLSRKLGDAVSPAEIMDIATKHLATLLGAGAAILLADDDDLRLHSVEPPDLVDNADQFVHDVQRWRIGEATSFVLLDSTTPDAPGWMLFPLRSEATDLGIVALYREQRIRAHSPERRLLDGIIGQVAIALERAALRTDIVRIRDREETERLRNAVLMSISHDLRTPLSTVIGALSSLKSPETELDLSGRDDLVGMALDEAKRLNEFIRNLLDISRLESGRLTARMAPVDLGEAIGAAFERARSLLTKHLVEIVIPPHTPLVQADASLLEQVVFNLLDNAAKYTPVGSRILLAVLPVDSRVTIEMIDEGGGIPDPAIETIFDKFTRVDDQRHGHPIGTGLGLAVCRGFIKVMGGEIRARNRIDRPGMIMSFWLEAVTANGEAAEGTIDDEY